MATKQKPQKDSKVLDWQLNPIQEKYLEAIDWLTSPNYIAQGRTHLLALAFITQAFRDEGTQIRCFDHFNPSSFQANRLIIEEIEKIASFNPILKSRLSISQSGPSIIYLNPSLTLNIGETCFQETRSFGIYGIKPDDKQI